MEPRAPILIPILTAFGVVGAGVFVYIMFNPPTPEREPHNLTFSMLSTNEEAISPQPLPQEGYMRYENEKFNMSFIYPKDALVREVDEGKGAFSIIVEDTKRVKGFQVFIVPYKESGITEERFRMDVPSGVRRNEQQVSIGGVEGVLFETDHVLFGAMTEVWFIRDGFLYEIAMPVSSKEWALPTLISFSFSL